MENLNEGKNKKPNYMAELAEIDKQSAIVAMEAKIDKLAEMIEAKTTRLNMVSEDENLSELIDKRRVREMQKEIKILEKEKSKMEKMYEKMGAKKKEIVDEEKKDDEMNEGGYGMPSYEEDDDKPSMEEELDEAHCNTEEDDVNEEVNRWQKLAGITEAFNPFLDTEEGGYMRVYIDDVVEDSMGEPESLDLRYRSDFDIAFDLALTKLKKDQPQLDFNSIEANKESFF
jgi:hypothetical protein